MADEWYFDERLWEQFYDCMFSAAQFEAGEAQVSQLIGLLGREPERVLDLACGPGRHTLPLCRAGFAVTAVDSSEYLLTDLRRRLQHEGLSAEVLQRDMREFTRPDSYDLALCMWSSFGYFDRPEDDLKVLKNVVAALNAGGRFVLDVVGKEYLARQLEPVMVRDFPDGAMLIEQPCLIDNMTRLSNRWTLVRGDSVYRTSFSHRCYSALELEDRLFAAGFKSVAIYGGLDGSEYNLDSERLLIVAGN